MVLLKWSISLILYRRINGYEADVLILLHRWQLVSFLILMVSR